jgi:hypothetical protein
LAIMSIPNLSALISNCWVAAEEELKNQVRIKYPDRDEEMITDLFHAELRVKLEAASSSGDVSSAFLSDLKEEFPKVLEESLASQVARRLIATVAFHSRSVETKTGGDLGIVLVRPNVEEGMSELIIHGDYKRGLLCQAKIFQRNSRWETLTANQKKILLPKLSYFALLLYRYSDQNGERRELEPFYWHLTQKASIEKITKWLASDNFPELQDSRQILGALADDRIGTNDKNIIDKDICPPLRPSLVITVRWKDGDDPGGSVYLPQNHSNHTVKHVQVRS